MPQPSKKLLLEIVRTASIGIFEFEPESGILKVDDTYASNLGYAKEELNSLEIWQKCIHPDYYEEVLRERKEFLEGSESSAVSVYLLQRKDQSYMWIKSTMFKSDKGTVIGCHIDISEEREAQQKIEKAKEEVLKSEAQLRSLFNAMEDLVFEMDYNGTYLNVAPTQKKFLLKTFEGVIGKTLQNVFPEVLAKRLLKVIRKCISKNKSDKIVYPLDLNGDTIWFEGRITPVEADKVLFIATDITDRKKADEALKESETRYRSVVSSLNEGFVLQSADGSIIASNAQAEEILGLTRDQMSGRTSLDSRWRSIHQDGTPFPGETHPTMETLKDGEARYNVIMGVHKPDGSLNWISINTEPLFNEKETSPNAVVASFTDITESMLREEKLVNSEEKLSQVEEILLRQKAIYQKIFEHVQTGLLITDNETTMLEINDAACSIIGLPREVLVGAKINDPNWILFDENYRDFKLEERPVCITAATGKAVAPIKMGYYKHDEPTKVKWVELSSSPLLNQDGELEKIVCTFLDVTEEHEAKQQLFLEKKRLDNVVNGTKLGTWEWNMQTNHYEFNSHWAEMIGYNIDDITFGSIEKWQNRVHPEDSKEIEKAIESHIVNNTENYSVEFRMKHKLGHWVWILARGKVISRDDAGNPLLFLGTHNDISERKKAEAQLKLEKKKIDNIIDGVKLGTWEWNSIDNHLELNSHWAETLGYRLEEISPLSLEKWKELTHPNDVKRIEKAVDNYFNGETKDYEEEFRMKHKEGHWIWVLERGKILRKEQDGQVSLFSGIQHDITKQKKQTEELWLFESVIKKTNEAVLISEINGETSQSTSIKFANKAFTELTGYTKSELNKASFNVLRGPLSNRETINLIEKATKNFEPFQCELINYKKNGDPFWINISATPVKNEKGEYTHWVTLQKDITKQRKQTEELRLFESVVKNTKDAVLITEAEPFELPGPKIVFVNEAFCKMTGYTSEELIGKTPRVLQGPKSDRKLLDKVKISLSKWESCEYDLINYKKNGEELWVNMSITPLADETGWFTHWIAVERDITEKKKAEALLAESEKKYRQLVENSNDIIYSVSPEGIFTFTSPAWQRLLGHTKEESEGHSFAEFVHPDDIPICATYLQKVIETANAQEEVIEYRVKHKDGHWVWHASSGAPQKDSTGNVIGYDGLARDITESKQMQEQIIKAKEAAEESEKRFKLATNAALLGIWDWNIETNEIIWDDRSYELYGWKKGGAKPNFETWSNSIHPEDIESALTELDLALKSKEIYNSKFRVVHPDGKELYINGYGIVLKNLEGNPARMIGVHRDITKEKTKEIELRNSKEKAEIANLAKSEFLANMSHEIRTPLNSVIGFSEILMQTKLDSAQKEYMLSVNYSANTLLDLINDILDFSKIEAGKLELSKERTQLNEILYQIVDIIKFKLSEKEIELLLYLAPDLPNYIYADAIRIRQILINLLGNAVKFTESGEIEVSVVKLAESKEESKTTLRFEVRDTGIGIPTDKQSRIFEAFSQEDTSTTRKYGGTGLGLPISNKLLSLMGSTLQLKSEKDKGSTFYFDIEFEFEPVKLEIKNTLENVHSILVIDDNARNMEIIKNMFFDSHIKVETTNSGFDALAKIQSNWKNYDLILLDKNMPFIDGTEVAKQIKEKLQLDEKALSIVMMDNFWNEEETILLKRNYSVIDFINKPVNKKDLFEHISLLKNLEVEKPIIPVDLENKQPKLSNFKGDSILIVDDNPVNRNLAKTMLKMLFKDMEIVEANNGKEAIEHVLLNDFKLILMDIQMPDMSGYETTRRIRIILDGKKSRSIIIALTARTVKGEKERCLASGMDDYMSKPVTLKKMKWMIKNWIHLNSIENIAKAQELINTAETSTKLDFNYKAMLNQFGENAEVVEKLLEMIRNGELRMYLMKLIEKSDDLSKNEDLIEELAHTIKGISLNFNFEKLAELANHLEDMYPNYDNNKARNHIKELEKAYDAVEKIILGMEYLKTV